MMNKTLRRIAGAVMLTVMMSISFGFTAQASSSTPGYFDFGETVLKMDAGTTKSIWMIANYDYTYYVGPHTSSATYMECTFNSGTENIILHIGPDETVKNVFFHFYVEDKRVGTCDIHDCIEVYVQKIDPEAVRKVDAENAAKKALKDFKGNTSEFNAFYYYSNYKDLRDAFGMDPEKLLNHYNTFGKNEKRIANKYL